MSKDADKCYTIEQVKKMKTFTLYAALFLTIMLAISLAVDAGETGDASYYHNSMAGNKTASGELYDPTLFTAAHKSLPFDTMVIVEHLKTHQAVKVRINDRGPFIATRIIDLSYAAAEALGIVIDGYATVYIEVIQEF